MRDESKRIMERLRNWDHRRDETSITAADHIEALEAEIARLKAEGIRGWAWCEDIGEWEFRDAQSPIPTGARPARLIMEDDDG